MAHGQRRDRRRTAISPVPERQVSGATAPSAAPNPYQGWIDENYGGARDWPTVAAGIDDERICDYNNGGVPPNPGLRQTYTVTGKDKAEVQQPGKTARPHRHPKK
jgi:hypothetical protein